MTTSSRPGQGGRGTRRSRRAAPPPASFLERNRTRLLWGVGVIGFALIVGMAFLNFTRPAYACTTIWDPADPVVPTAPPAASGEPQPTTPAPGIVQPDMGHVHENNTGATIRYQYCPPASGKHYPSPGGPIRPGVYGPNDPATPGGWVHNLEHGGIALLYKCPGPGCDDAGQSELSSLYGRWPNSPVCSTPPGVDSPVIARFDDMAWNYAAIVWDVVLPMQTLDETLLFDFYARQGERFNPERQCAEPTPTPGPTPTAGPTASPGSTATAEPAASDGSAASPAGSEAPASSASPGAS